MSIDIQPSDLALPGHLWDSPLKNFEAELVARNVVIMSQVGAWVTGQDIWLPFTETDYREYRAADNPASPLGHREMDGFRTLVRRGYLSATEAEDDQLEVSDSFLGMLAEYKQD